MGCDIHLFAEVKTKPTIWKRLIGHKEKWETCDVWKLDKDWEIPRMTVDYEDSIYTGGRNYNLFCALCGVRGNSFKDSPPSISLPKGLPVDCCNEIKKESESWDSDGHSHSWNTLQELKDFDFGPYGKTVTHFLEEVCPKLEAFRVHSDHVRIVYFFDN